MDENQKLKFLARRDELVKINGEIVNIKQLRSVISKIILNEGYSFEFDLVSQFNFKSLNQLDLVVEGVGTFHQAKHVKEVYNSNVSPFERIKSVYFVSALNRTDLGKVKKIKFHK